MKLKKGIIIAMFFMGVLCVGCGTDSAGEGEQLPAATPASVSGEETDIEDLAEATVKIHVFTQEDMVVIPEIKEYDFAAAQEAGTMKKLQGMLPGATEGTWYIIETNGIEYYYGKYDTSEEITLFGYSIISNQYSLANGITVGMKQEEILAEYPDMAVMDFEGDYLQKKVTGHQGWNNVAYPRSYIDMDDEWDYNGEDYYWEDQFDYIMIADIDLGTYDTLPLYVGLLVKDDMVSAITYKYPTAG